MTVYGTCVVDNSAGAFVAMAPNFRCPSMGRRSGGHLWDIGTGGEPAGSVEVGAGVQQSAEGRKRFAKSSQGDHPWDAERVTVCGTKAGRGSPSRTLASGKVTSYGMKTGSRSQKR